MKRHYRISYPVTNISKINAISLITLETSFRPHLKNMPTLLIFLHLYEISPIYTFRHVNNGNFSVETLVTSIDMYVKQNLNYWAFILSHPINAAYKKYT